MFKTRLISGIVLVILALATIICSGPVLLVTLIGVSCIGMQELYRAAGVHEGKTNGLEIAGYLAVVIYYLTIAYLPVSYHLPAVILGVLVMMCIFVFTYPKYQNKQIMTAFFGCFSASSTFTCARSDAFIPRNGPPDAVISNL
jgi:phosphatidate cytidylyltransferase